MSPSSATVFVVDDDESVRGSLKNLIRSVGLAVETFSSPEDFLHHKRHDAPSCLVLDVRLPRLSGLDVQKRLAESEAEIPISISGHGDIPMAVQAMKAGAVEFLTKPFRDQDLLDAIHQALEYDRKERAQRMEIEELRRRSDKLTSREREVMRLVVAGLLNKQISAELGTSETTIKIQRHQVMEKMHAKSLAELARMAERLGSPALKY